MKKLLKKISKKTKTDFLKPVEEASILKTEKRLGIELPKDYKELLQTSNGFPTVDESTEPSFLSVENIDYLKNIETYTIESYSIEGFEEIGKQLERSIVIAGKEEEQYFLLISPLKKEEKWKYWKFASWIPGKEEYENLEEYFKELLELIEETY